MFLNNNSFIKLFKSYSKLIFPSLRDTDGGSAHTSGQEGSGTNIGGGGNTAPSLYDLTTKDMASIMRDMGFSEADVQKYSGYVPVYDPWKEEFSQREMELGQERLGLERQSVMNERDLSQQLYGLGQESLMNQMSGVTTSGEQSLYDIFSQSSSVQGAGLGSRANLTGRARSSVINQSAQQSDILSMQGQEQTARYGAAMEGFESQLGLMGVEEQGLTMDYERDVTSAQQEYEDEFWDFMTFLQSEFEVGFM